MKKLITFCCMITIWHIVATDNSPKGPLRKRQPEFFTLNIALDPARVERSHKEHQLMLAGLTHAITTDSEDSALRFFRNVYIPHTEKILSDLDDRYDGVNDQVTDYSQGQCLQSKPTKTSLLSLAFAHNKLAVAKELLDKGAQIHTSDERHLKPINCAWRLPSGRLLKATQLLLQYEHDPGIIINYFTMRLYNDRTDPLQQRVEKFLYIHNYVLSQFPSLTPLSKRNSSSMYNSSADNIELAMISTHRTQVQKYFSLYLPLHEEPLQITIDYVTPF